MSAARASAAAAFAFGVRCRGSSVAVTPLSSASPRCGANDFPLVVYTMVAQLLCVMLAANGLAAPARPSWPPSFSAHFEEFFSNGNGTAHHGLFALDVAYIDNATGIAGAQAIYRDSSPDETCHAVNPQGHCIQLSVGGQRYLLFEEGTPQCCRCCSWANGCGPTRPAWTENATLEGTRVVRGQTCYVYRMTGRTTSHLLVRASDGQVAELDRGGVDFMQFIPLTYQPRASPELFRVPSGCDAWCGPHADCKRK